jgi:hypothetical protein
MVFGLTRQGFKTMIYRTRVENVTNYTTGVWLSLDHYIVNIVIGIQYVLFI